MILLIITLSFNLCVYIGWSKYPSLKSTVFTGCLLTSYSQIPNEFPNKLIKFHTFISPEKKLKNKIQTSSEIFSANLLFYLSILSFVYMGQTKPRMKTLNNSLDIA